MTVEITFAKLTFYTVSFVETGLPNGTFWWVDLGGAPFFPAASSASGASPEWGHGGNGSGFNFTTIQFELPNGTYDFSVGNFSVNDSLFVPSPANGTVTVNGANVTISIVFSDPPLAGHLSSPGLRPAAPALKLPAGPWLGAGIAALALLGAGIVTCRAEPRLGSSSRLGDPFALGRAPVPSRPRAERLPTLTPIFPLPIGDASDREGPHVSSGRGNGSPRGVRDLPTYRTSPLIGKAR